MCHSGALWPADWGSGPSRLMFGLFNEATFKRSELNDSLQGTIAKWQLVGGGASLESAAVTSRDLDEKSRVDERRR